MQRPIPPSRRLVTALAVVFLPFVASACGDPVEGEEREPPPKAGPTGAGPTDPGDAGGGTGPAATGFSLVDLDGATHDLADLRGSIVVLEWFDPDCPFVTHAHSRRGTLRTLADDWSERGVVWLAINSSAPGEKAGDAEHNRALATAMIMRHPILLDPTGEVGRKYGIEMTPTVVVLDAEGHIAYRGAPDNEPRGVVRGGGERVSYVANALEQLAAGRTVDPAEQDSYGCPVKYAD